MKEAFAFLVALSQIALVVWVLRTDRERRRLARERRFERSQPHEFAVNALSDWLTDEEIVTAIVRSGTATAAGMQGTLNELEGMSEMDARVALAVLLQHRNVRRVVAKRYHEQHGGDEKRLRQELLGLAAIASPDARLELH